jgi:HD-like signal output (HDOD) protein
MKVQDVKQIIESIDALPPLPETAIKLIEVINDPSSSVDQIIDTIKYDQAVTSELLRYCNSAYVRLCVEVNSLADAVMELGVVKVMQLVLSLQATSLLANSEKSEKTYGKEAVELWKTSVSVALTASALADRVHLANPNTAFTAGLLHEVGKIVMIGNLGYAFDEVHKVMDQKKVGWVDAEWEVFGFSHVEVGTRVSKSWNLPNEIAHCIQYHRDPIALEPSEPLVDVVYLARLVAKNPDHDDSKMVKDYDVSQDVMERIGLRQDDLHAARKDMQKEFNQIFNLFHHVL